MKTNVALIGFMGTGKSAVGRELARRLGKEFVEMDELIVERAGKPIPRIFREDGEAAFRQMEMAVAKEVAGRSNQVIACGGGVVLNRVNIDRLRQTSRLVHLVASPATILQRTRTQAGQRPLLDVADPAGRIIRLLEERQPLYQAAADIVVETDGQTVAGVADTIITRLKEDEGYAFPE